MVKEKLAQIGPLSIGRNHYAERPEGAVQELSEPAPIDRTAALPREARPVSCADPCVSEIPFVPTLRRIRRTARK